MTTGEARRAYGEMVESMDPEHAEEVDEMIEEAERKQATAAETDSDD
jgi:hypothetical protein